MLRNYWASHEPKSHATRHHEVVAGEAAARLGGVQDALAVDGLDVEAAEAQAAAICRRDESDGGIVEGELRVAGVARRNRPIEDFAPSIGERGRVVGLNLGREHGPDDVQASGRGPVGSGGVPWRVVVAGAVVLSQLDYRAGHVLGVQLDALVFALAHVRHQSNVQPGDALPRGRDVVALGDDHVAAVAASPVQVALRRGACAHGGDDLQEVIADGQEEVAQAEPADVRVAVADFQPEDGA